MDGQQQIEIIPHELYWTTAHAAPKDTGSVKYFCIDDELVYQPFVNDFGPLSLASTWRYCKKVEWLLSQERGRRRLVQYTSFHPHKRANAACVAGCYRVIVLGMSPQEAWRPLSTADPPFMPFRDATYGASSANLYIIDVLRGLHRAMELKWFDYASFDVNFFEFYETVENGDFNWIIPGKMLAFAGPSPTDRDASGWRVCTPEHFIPIFRSLNIGVVVRLNQKQYDRQRFISNGVKHVDLYFADGSCPPSEIIDRFLHVAENQENAVAVHCKAGLGRTATLIGLYAMKHYGISALEFIGWVRLARPGSILGPQHQFLIEMEAEMMKAGSRASVEEVTAKLGNLALTPPRERKDLVQPDSPFARPDKNQGERLTETKRQAQQQRVAS